MEHIQSVPQMTTQMASERHVCRRDNRVAIMHCANPQICGSYCSNYSATEWKMATTTTSDVSGLQQRRMQRVRMIQQVMTILHQHYRIVTTTPTNQVQECSSMHLRSHLAKYFELLIFRAAYSVNEYTCEATLRRRIEWCAVTMNTNPKSKIRIFSKPVDAVRVSDQASGSHQPAQQQRGRVTPRRSSKRVWLFTSRRWKSTGSRPRSPIGGRACGTLINANQHCLIMPTPSMNPISTTQIVLELHVQGRWSQLFDGAHPSVLIQIFSFLGGQEVVRDRAVNRHCHAVLPLAITTLRLPDTHVLGFLASIGSSFMPNLRQLSIISKRSDAPQVNEVGIVASCSALFSSPPPCDDATDSMRGLADFLRQGRCPSLQMLSLCSLHMCDEGIYHVTEALRHQCCRDLQVLRLVGSHIGDYGAMRVGVLVGSMACPKLSLLDLRSCFVGQDGLRYLASAFATVGSMSSLTKLCLGGNVIGESAFYELAPAFRSGAFSRLTFLGLDNNFLTKNCIQSLASEIVRGNCPQLREVCLGGNQETLRDSDIVNPFRDMADSVDGSTWGLFAPRKASALALTARTHTRAIQTRTATSLAK